MSFQAAVQAAPTAVAGAYRPGKQALPGQHRSLVTCADSRRLTGSVNLDAALQASLPNAPRWDYGLGYQPVSGAERAVWIEVHPAATSNVGEVLRKLYWLRSWLSRQGRALNRLTQGTSGVQPFVWIATGHVGINANSPQRRRLNQSGLGMPRRRLTLP